MNYIKKNEDLVQNYKVEIDTERLKKILVLLDKDCSIRHFGTVVRDDDAIKHVVNNVDVINLLSSTVNHANERVNEVFEFKGFEYWSHGQPYDMKYEAIYKKSVGLVRIIEKLLEYSDKRVNGTNLINALQNYDDSQDFIPFDVRAEQALMDVNALRAANSPKTLEAIHKYMELNIIAKLNEGYDFNRLRALHLEAMNCIKYNLVSETRLYKNDNDKKTR